MPEFFRWVWAGIWGYFWLPCDGCDRHIAGFEKGITFRNDLNPLLLCQQCTGKLITHPQLRTTPNE